MRKGEGERGQEDREAVRERPGGGQRRGGAAPGSEQAEGDEGGGADCRGAPDRAVHGHVGLLLVQPAGGGGGEVRER